MQMAPVSNAGPREGLSGAEVLCTLTWVFRVLSITKYSILERHEKAQGGRMLKVVTKVKLFASVVKFIIKLST